MIEEWRPIKGYETHYAVSNLGRVKSLDRVVIDRTGRARLFRSKMLRLHPLGLQYLQTHLSKDGIVSQHCVHRLVACAFIGDPPNAKSQVNHLNFIGRDNRPSNLEWLTPFDNMQHAVAGKRHCPHENPNKRKKLSPEQVENIRNLLAAGERQVDVAQRFALNQSTVSRIKTEFCWPIDNSVNNRR